MHRVYSHIAPRDSVGFALHQGHASLWYVIDIVITGTGPLDLTEIGQQFHHAMVRCFELWSENIWK